jgi:hypothetical protein
MSPVIIRHCERSEAISRLPGDRFVASLLGMTVTNSLWNRLQG